MRYRQPNKECFCCGTQVPNKVEREQADDYTRYVCPKCGNIIAEGVVATNGNPARSPRSIPVKANQIQFGEDTDFGVCEVWWTNLHYVGAIHGRTILGDKNLLDLVEKISSIYDDST